MSLTEIGVYKAAGTVSSAEVTLGAGETLVAVAATGDGGALTIISTPTLVVTQQQSAEVGAAILAVGSAKVETNLTVTVTAAESQYGCVLALYRLNGIQRVRQVVTASGKVPCEDAALEELPLAASLCVAAGHKGNTVGTVEWRAGMVPLLATEEAEHGTLVSATRTGRVEGAVGFAAASANNALVAFELEEVPGEGFALTSPFGQEAADHLEPWLSEDLERWLDAIGVIFDPVYTLARETGTAGEAAWIPGYGVIFDVDECPPGWLPYLGQYVGVKVPVGAPEAEARALVRAESGKERGTLAAVESAVSRSLSGAKAFRIIERRNAAGEEDAYWFLILVYSESEMPSEATLRANVNAVKPGGVFYTVIVGGLTFAVLEAAHATFALLEAAHATFADMETKPSA